MGRRPVGFVDERAELLGRLDQLLVRDPLQDEQVGLLDDGTDSELPKEAWNFEDGGRAVVGGGRARVAE